MSTRVLSYNGLIVLFAPSDELFAVVVPGILLRIAGLMPDGNKWYALSFYSSPIT